MSYLEQIDSREALCALDYAQLKQLCEEIRAFLVQNVAQTGGHLASNLGVTELSVAIERVFDTKTDRLVFDVGHQSYVHKLLTGRRDEFSTLRRFGGLSGFPNPEESEADAFVAGHASTAVSTALGMARARTLQKEHYNVIALMGDGAMTGGTAYEAMNDAGESNEPLIVILNDNGMSICPNVGGVASHLRALRTRPGYFRLKRVYRTVTNALPGGKAIYRFTHRLKETIKRRVLNHTLFDEMGFEYYGPIDGHDLEKLEYMLRLVRDCERPVLLHVITKKGKGYRPAEENPDVFHGIGKFDPATGAPSAASARSFSAVFGSELCEIAENEPRVCAVTAAMPAGTGLSDFAARFPERFFDVGIAEGHAVAMAGGLAKQGMIPVVAIYSTFLQRAYDMILQDTAMLNLHTVFAVDRAGLVGEDGRTHHGVFDVGFLRSVPNLRIFCPANDAELRDMLRKAIFETDGPVAVRYPRGAQGAYREISASPVLREGSDITLVGYGTLMNELLAAAELLGAQKISAEVLKLDCIQPLPLAPVLASVKKTGRLLVAEETASVGCVGEALLAALNDTHCRARLCNLGGGFVTHGSVRELYRLTGLDAASLARAAREVCADENERTT